jgi:hypothetical protein
VCAEPITVERARPLTIDEIKPIFSDWEWPCPEAESASRRQGSKVQSFTPTPSSIARLTQKKTGLLGRSLSKNMTSIQMTGFGSRHLLMFGGGFSLLSIEEEVVDFGGRLKLVNE